ncbi:putative isomerase YbhE [Xylariomycetidae sp. FL2044]|nr:putative isomerase YbhE [Xylariomycetidae sp. FL2044]
MKVNCGQTSWLQVCCVCLIVAGGGIFRVVIFPFLHHHLKGLFFGHQGWTLLDMMWKGVFPAGPPPPLLLLLSSSVGLAGLATATAQTDALLYVSSYAGSITTLKLTLPADEGAAAATLEPISNSTECGPQPSWLALDYSKSFLFCTNEGFSTPFGNVTSFFTNSDGSLSLIESLGTIQGPVSTAEYGVGGHGLAVAHYSGSGVSVVGMTPEGGLTLVQNETYALEEPGPNPDRQEAPHPHDAILDPTAAFILIPDLGADVVRIFQANADDLSLTPVAPLVAAPGSGPRHGVFKAVLDKTYFYLVAELANTITGYEVTYNEDKTLGFEEIFVIPTHGEEVELPEGTGAAEIRLSPDENFLIVSSRWESPFNITNFDPTNSTEIPSDPLIVFAVDRASGGLSKIQEFPAGGSGPRQFSINGDGDLVAVGLQADGRVVVIERDVETGLLVDYLAWADIPGEVTAAIFYEDYH